MLPRVTRVQHLRACRLSLTFSDRVTGELDLESSIVGRRGVFRPLESVDFFSQVMVDTDAGTIAWPNGVDLCPDVLYSQVTGKPVPSLQAA